MNVLQHIVNKKVISRISVCLHILEDTNKLINVSDGTLLGRYAHYKQLMKL